VSGELEGAAPGPAPQAARLTELLLRGCPDGDVEEVRRMAQAWLDGSLHKRCPSPLHLASKVGDVAAVHALLEEFHADVNSIDATGMTPLHTAAEAGQVAVVRLLLQIPAVRANAQDDFGWTPLHYAACCLEDTSPELLVMLVRHGASVTVPDVRGYTAPDWAYCLGRDHVLSLLRSQELSVKLNKSCFPSFADFDPSSGQLRSSMSSVSQLASSGVNNPRSVLAAGQPALDGAREGGDEGDAGANAEAATGGESGAAGGSGVGSGHARAAEAGQTPMEVDAVSDGVQDKSSHDDGCGVADAAGSDEGNPGQSAEGSRPDSKDGQGGSTGSNTDVTARGSNKELSGLGQGQSNALPRGTAGAAEGAGPARAAPERSNAMSPRKHPRDETGSRPAGRSGGAGNSRENSSGHRSGQRTNGSGGTGSGGSNGPFGPAPGMPPSKGGAGRVSAPESGLGGEATRESASRVLGVAGEGPGALAAQPAEEGSPKKKHRGGQSNGPPGSGRPKEGRKRRKTRLQDSQSDSPSRREWYGKGGEPGDAAGLIMSREEELAFLQANYHQLSLQFVMEYNRINREKWRLRGTALHAAAMTGLLPVIKVLTGQVGFSAGITLPNGTTPLHLAAQHGHASALEVLLGLEGNAVNLQDSSGCTPICCAVENNHLAAVETLIEHGAALDMLCGPLEIAPLHMAIAKGHREIAKKLISSGASTTTFDHRMLSPLHFAALKRDEEMAKYLTEDIDPPVNVDIHLNIKQWRCCGPTPLHVAFGAGSLQMARWLLAKGADIGITTSQGETAVHWAMREGHIELLKDPYILGLLESNPVIQASLRPAQSSPQEKSSSPSSPAGVLARPLVHAAVASSQHEVVEFAVKDLGLDLDARNVHDANRHTLHVASQSSLEIFDYVLSILARQWEQNYGGSTLPAPGHNKSGSGGANDPTNDLSAARGSSRPQGPSDQTPSTRPVGQGTGTGTGTGSGNGSGNRSGNGSGTNGSRNAAGLEALPCVGHGLLVENNGSLRASNGALGTSGQGSGSGAINGAAVRLSGVPAPKIASGSGELDAHGSGSDGLKKGSNEGVAAGRSLPGSGGQEKAPGKTAAGSDGTGKGTGESGAGRRDERSRQDTRSSHHVVDNGRHQAVAAAIADTILDEFDATLLHTAVQSLHPRAMEVARFLVNTLGVRTTCRGSDGSTPLHLAAMGSPLLFAEVAPFLVAHGADVNCRNDDDNTPLHITCMVNSVPSARILLELGADITMTNSAGKTPLMVASRWPAMLQQQEGMRKALLQKVIDSTHADAAGPAGAIPPGEEGSGFPNPNAASPPADADCGAPEEGVNPPPLEDGVGDAQGNGNNNSGSGGGGTGGTRGHHGSNQLRGPGGGSGGSGDAGRGDDPSVPGVPHRSKGSGSQGNVLSPGAGPPGDPRTAAATGGSSVRPSGGGPRDGVAAAERRSSGADSAVPRALESPGAKRERGSPEEGHAPKRPRTEGPGAAQAEGSRTVGPFNAAKAGAAPPPAAGGGTSDPSAAGQPDSGSGAGASADGATGRHGVGSLGASAGKSGSGKGSAPGASGSSFELHLRGAAMPALERNGKPPSGGQGPPWARPEVQLMMQVMVGVSMQSMQARKAMGDSPPESVHELLLTVLQLPEAMTRAGTAMSLAARGAARAAAAAREGLGPDSSGGDMSPSGGRSPTPGAADPKAASDDKTNAAETPSPREDVASPSDPGGSSGDDNSDGDRKMRLLDALAALPQSLVDRIASMIPVATVGFSVPTINVTAAAREARGAGAMEVDTEDKESL